MVSEPRAGHPRPGRGQGQPERETSGARKGADCGQLVGAAAACSARKGGRLQGTRKGLPPTANPTTNRGNDANRRGGCPLAGRLPLGKGSCRLRRGNDY
ncbi:hypothetical protein GW17_00061024 [Ensete ventricosum]|nr:hypothetical protein GW17_00061024 [Ensete ventricosum]